MNFNFTAEQNSFKESVFKFAQNEILPGSEERDKEYKFGLEEWKKMGELGLHGLWLPEKYGGSEADAITTYFAAEAFEKGGRDAGMALSWFIQLVVSKISLLKYGTEAQKKKYLPKLASGEMIAAFAVTEPETGSDLEALQTKAENKNGKYIINGKKIFITNGSIADLIIVHALTGKGKEGVSAFIVEKGNPGVKIRDLEKLGYRSSPTSEIIFENCEIPAENMLGEEGKGYEEVNEVMDHLRGIYASGCLGACEAIIDEAIQYAKDRVQFGRPIGRFQAIQFKIADMKTYIEMGRLVAVNVAYRLDKGLPITQQAAVAKVFLGEARLAVALEGAQIHGGYGYCKEFPIERVLRDSRLATMIGGSSEMLRSFIVDQIEFEKFEVAELVQNLKKKSGIPDESLTL